MEKEQMEIIEGHLCPMCQKKTLSLTETAQDIPYFGMCYIFSMTCTTCKYHKSDVETEQTNAPTSFSVEIKGDADMKIRIVKSSEATIKIPYVMTIEPGTAANGYVTNVEGIINRAVRMIESARDQAEDKSGRKKAKNLLKKLEKVKNGEESLKIILDDPTGNSAIISEKAVKKALKKN